MRVAIRVGLVMASGWCGAGDDGIRLAACSSLLLALAKLAGST